MANAIDPNSGFCPQTRTFYSLCPNVPLPPPSHPLSVTNYSLSLIPPTASSTTALIDSATDRRVPYSLFLQQFRNLTSSLASLTSLSKGQVAFILSPASIHVPVLYYSLLSLGVIVSPANPIASDSEVAQQVELAQPIIAFATSSTAHKIPKLQYGTVLIDSPEFLSMINGTSRSGNTNNRGIERVQVNQSDPAAILFSSGTTGRTKGVLLTHRNLIAGFYHPGHRQVDPVDIERYTVSLVTVPLFHVFGFCVMIRLISMGKTMVFMQRFDFEGMLKTVQRYKVKFMPVSPPLIVALTKSELVNKYDLSSLRLLGCGGAPLRKEMAENFKARFPDVDLRQVSRFFTLTLWRQYIRGGN